MKKLIAGAMLPLFMYAALVSCDKRNVCETAEIGDSWTEEWVIGSKVLTSADGTAFYWTKKGDNPVWQLVKGEISGFEFKEGIECVVQVEISQMSESAPLEYSVSKVLSRECKSSDVPALYSNPDDCPRNDEESYLDFSEGDEVRVNGLSLTKKDSVYILEGDILLSKRQVSAVLTKSGCMSDETLYWPGNKVYYTFADDFTMSSSVEKAIAMWEENTSLTFINGTGIGNYIEFFHGNGNYSYLGMIGGKQQISIDIDGGSTGAARHEIGHAIGLIHEQCRNDRDSYVKIYSNNIISDKLSNFEKYDSGVATDIGTFDFGSLMIYGSYAFAIDTSQPTMTTIDGFTFSSQRSKLSSGDLEGVAAIYGPPFHSLEETTTVLEYSVDATNETYEAEVEYWIEVFEDYDCTVSSTLKYDRPITVYFHNVVYNTDKKKYVETIDTFNITMYAGENYYYLGKVHNIERYTNSNPDEYDVSYYFIDPYRTELR